MTPPSAASLVLTGDKTRWDAFNWGRHPALAQAKRAIVDWYNDLPNSGALVLAGNVGSGKTHIALAIYDIFGHWRASFFEEIALAKAIQKTYDDRALSEDGFVRQALFRPELFILDDLGAYQARDMSWMQNIYNRIFNDYLTVQGKPLIITTNRPLMVGDGKDNANTLERRIGNRAFSRLCGAMQQSSYIDLFNVSDFRIEAFLKYNERIASHE